MNLSRTQRIVVVAVVASLVAVSGGLALMALHPGDPPEGRLVIVASFYPVWEFTSRVAGDDVRVEMLVPAGVDPHDWEPRPGDIALVQDADLVVYVHPDFETFLPAILETLDAAPPTVVVSEGLDLLHFEEAHDHEEENDHHEEVDPHIWLDPLHAIHMVERIRDALTEVDPAFATRYEANAEVVVQRLQTLHAEFEAGLVDCELDVFITAHGAFRYLAHRYGLTVEYITVEPEVEPTPARIEELIAFAEEHGITVIFVEPHAPTGAAEAIAEAIEGEIRLLDPMEGVANPNLEVGPNYFTIMRNNLENLRVGLGCT